MTTDELTPLMGNHDVERKTSNGAKVSPPVSRDEIGTNPNKTQRSSCHVTTVVAIAIGLVLGGTIGMIGMLQRKHHLQQIHHQVIVVQDEPTTVQTTTTTTTTTRDADTSSNTKMDASSTSNSNKNKNFPTMEENTPAYRSACEYYWNQQDFKSKKPTIAPRILQTSMLEPSQPWRVQLCTMAKNPNHVAINEYAAPDAILQIQFTSNSDDIIMGDDTEIMSTTNNKTKQDDRHHRMVHHKPIIGFGGAFTEASAKNFQRLQPSGQETALELLFGKSGLGYSIGRIPIHSCDFSLESYNFDNVTDDFHLHHFDHTVQHDVASGMIDFAQRALQKYQYSWENSNFHLLASPWSPPGWMKRPTNSDKRNAIYSAYMTGSATPNCLRDGVGPHSKYAAAWALYFSKHISAYQDHNLTIWAVTVQNEPEFPAPWEACAYTAQNMTDFVAYHLGPTLAKYHPNVKILGFDHNKDHINHWVMTMLNGTDDSESNHRHNNKTNASVVVESSTVARQYLAGTAYHWYAGGMDRLLDGALGIANLHRLQENLATIGRAEDHILLGSESCHCPTTGYAGGDINIYWDRAERYAHTVLADLAAGSQGWVEWNLLLDSIGGPNHLGNLCESTILAVPHRALDAAASTMSSLPDFEHSQPMGGTITGDNRTREELNALGFLAKYLDAGIAVQPIYYYMGHISRHVRPGSLSVPGLVLASLGHRGKIFRFTDDGIVAGGGENDLARSGIEILLWPCEGSTRQYFEWNVDFTKHISVHGHDWLGQPTKSCIARKVDPDFLGLRLDDCKRAGEYDAIPIEDDEEGRYIIRLLNPEPMDKSTCLGIRKLKNNGGSYGPLGGAQVTLTDCMDESAKWNLDLGKGVASSMYFADANSDNEVCMTTGWPFLQMGAFLTPNGDSTKTVVILNEAKDSANYAVKDDNNVLLTGSIPPRSIQTLLID